MTIPQSLQQQDMPARAIVACVRGDWLRIVVNPECAYDDERDNTLSFYPKRKDRDIETLDLCLPHLRRWLEAAISYTVHLSYICCISSSVKNCDTIREVIMRCTIGPGKRIDLMASR